MIAPLSQANEVTEYGGKAVSLCKLITAGFNVPLGFVVAAGADIDRLESQILADFDKLRNPEVAVRSSAVAEDGQNDAWAGQFDTFLKIKRTELIDAVKKCQKSSSSTRAEAYAKQKNIQSGQVAVIVQDMIPAEKAGVAFSVHPVTDDRSLAVVEAIRGLGEKLVSGINTPDTYVADKQTITIKESHLVSDRAVLDQSQLEELIVQICKIEKLFGFPVDVEWAFAKNKLYILQSRPITTMS